MTTKTTRPHLSFSQLSMFLRCSQQYYFRYVLGIIEPPSLPQATGTGGHTTLEMNAKRKMETGTDASLEEIVDVAHTEISKQQAEVPKENIKPTEKPSEMRDNAVNALKLYRLRDAPMVKPVAVEMPFDVEIEPNEQYPTPIRVVNGRIDLIDTMGIEDNKFPRQRTTQEAVDINIQLTTYDMVAQQKGYPVHRLGLRQFGATKTDGPYVTPVYRSKAFMTPEARAGRIERVKNQFRAAEAQISAGIFIPVDDPRVCSWCGYLQRCQQPSAIEAKKAQ